MTRLELTHEESEALRFVLENYLGELRMEISNTDRFDFRAGLKRREEIVKKVLADLGRGGEAVSGETGSEVVTLNPPGGAGDGTSALRHGG